MANDALHVLFPTGSNGDSGNARLDFLENLWEILHRQSPDFHPSWVREFSEHPKRMRCQLSKARVMGQTFAALVGLIAPVCLAADCRVPDYRRGHIWEDSPSSIMMNISIPISDFAPARLVCLAAALKHRYSDRQEIAIYIFSSYAGAKNYISPARGDSLKPQVNWSLQEHGSYSFDAGKHEEFVYIAPFGDQYRKFNTRIDLRTTSIPPCALNLAGRCLLALSSVEYPWSALKSNVSGTVTLEAVVARDGRMKRVRDAGPDAHPREGYTLLADGAIQNLKTWRFETAPRQHRVRIEYSYTIDPSGDPGHVIFQFDLPGKVEIRGTPPQ